MKKRGHELGETCGGAHKSICVKNTEEENVVLN